MTRRVFDINLDMYLWDEIEAGELSFIIRDNEKNFQRGDIVNLYKYDCTHDNSGFGDIDGRFVAKDEHYSKRANTKECAKLLTATITFVWPVPLSEAVHGVILNLKLIPKESARE